MRRCTCALVIPRCQLLAHGTTLAAAGRMSLRLTPFSDLERGLGWHERALNSSSVGHPLTRNRSAPAAMASAQCMAYMVSITTLTSDHLLLISRVASRPSSTGIRTSISTTSGRWSSTSRTASRPSVASQTTSTVGQLPSSARNPPRDRGRSSAINTRMCCSMMSPICVRRKMSGTSLVDGLAPEKLPPSTPASPYPLAQ
jgi:hypothetical protein